MKIIWKPNTEKPHNPTCPYLHNVARSKMKDPKQSVGARNLGAHKDPGGKASTPFRWLKKRRRGFLDYKNNGWSGWRESGEHTE